MRKQLNYLFGALCMIALIMPVLPASAQRRYAAVAPTGESDFKITISNVVQTRDRILEFDICLVDAEAAHDFELATIQAGILLNSSVLAGGTPIVQVVPGSSTLNSLQSPTITGLVDNLKGYPDLTLIRLASRGAPGAGYGTILSKRGLGDRVIRLRLINSVPFTANSTPGLTLTTNKVQQPLYPTRVAQYISGINVQLDVNPGQHTGGSVPVVLNPTGVAPAGYAETKDAGINQLENIRVFSYDKTIVIEKPATLTGDATIYDMTGRKMHTQALSAQSRISVPVAAPTGTYLVHLTTVNGSFNTKVFLR